MTRDHYAAVSVGQLKRVAKPFYDRLGLAYPWGTGLTTDDFAVANAGQLKRVFSFLVPDAATLGLTDTDGDGFSDVLEFTQGTNPYLAGTKPAGGGDVPPGGGDGGDGGNNGEPPVTDGEVELATRRTWAGLIESFDRTTITVPFDSSGPDETLAVATTKYEAAKAGAATVSEDEEPHEVPVVWTYKYQVFDPETSDYTEETVTTEPKLQAEAQSDMDLVGGFDLVPANGELRFDWRVAGTREETDQSGMTDGYLFSQRVWGAADMEVVYDKEHIAEMTEDAPLSWLDDALAQPADALGDTEWLGFAGSGMSASISGTWAALTGDDDIEHFFPEGGAMEVRLRRKDVTNSTLEQPVSRTFLRIRELGDTVLDVDAVTLTIAAGEKVSRSGAGLDAADGSVLLLGSPDNENRTDYVTERLVGIDMEVLPSEGLDDTIVPADVHAIDILATVTSDGIALMEAQVEWTVTRGGGSVSEQVSTIALDEPETETTLTTSTNPGDEYEVQSTLKSVTLGNEETPEEWQTFQVGGIQEKSGIITVGPGGAGDIQFAITDATGSGSGASMPADGMSTREITVTVRDSFGNIVAPGAPVAWRLKGDGWFTDQFASYQSQTDADGKAHATLLAGRIPGLPQTVIVETDFKREEYVIENTALNFDLTAGQVATTLADALPVKRTFSVTASVTAANGTPIRCRTSKGRIIASSATVQGGAATATVEVTPAWTGAPEDGFDGLAVVTAAVAKSTAIASVNLGDIEIRQDTPVMQPGGEPVPVEVFAPQLAGQEVTVSAVAALQQQVQAFDAPALQAATGSLAAAPHLNSSLTYGGLQVDVTVQQPAEGAVAATLLEEPGVYTLALDEDGQPVLKVQTSLGEDPLVLSDPAGAVLAGDSKTIRLSLTSTTAMVSVGNSSAVMTLRGPPLAGSTAVSVPQASLSRVTAAVFTWQAQAADGTLALTGLTNGTTLTLDGTGSGTFQAALSEDFSGTAARIHVAPAAAGSGVRPAEHALAAGQDAVEAEFSAVWEEVAELHTGVSFDNRTGGSATPGEQQELSRYGAAAAISSQNSGYRTGLDKLAPLEHGGALPHQAQQGKKYLEMAAKLDTAAAEIEKMVAATNAVTVTDESGKQLFAMDIGDQLQKKVEDMGWAAWSWVTTQLKPLSDTIDSVKTTAAQSLAALVDSVKSTETWRHAQSIAKEMGNIPLLRDAKQLVDNLTDEGMVEYLKALWRFAKVAGTNPQAAAMYGFAQLEDIIKGPLNDWARDTGEGTQVAVAAAGLLAYVVQTGTMLASTACDNGAAKRMVSQMLGTVLSAAFGSQEAQDQLKEMVPFYSWLMMGEQIADLWTGKNEDGSNATPDGLPDYYGAGKKAAELIVQVIGDVTILIPVVKGATVAIKAGTKVSTVLVQALKKTATGIVREMNPLDGITGPVAGHIIKKCRGIRCFPAGTMVLMADGALRPIERVRAGEYVLADDPRDSAPPAAQRVEEVVTNWTQRLVDIKTDRNGDDVADAEFSATGEHPFWTQEHGWTGAKDIRAGDHLVSPDCSMVTVVSTDERPVKVSTWNLTVAQSHAFYVVDSGCAVLVHNTSPGPKQWIVYIAPLKSDPARFYVGIASKPSSGPGVVRPLEVLAYRAGKNGSAHHKALMGHVDGDNIQMIGSWWASGKTDGKWVARGIEDLVHDYLIANDSHDTAQNKPIADGSKGYTNPRRTQYRNAAQNSAVWNDVIYPSLPCE